MKNKNKYLRVIFIFVLFFAIFTSIIYYSFSYFIAYSSKNVVNNTVSTFNKNDFKIDVSNENISSLEKNYYKMNYTCEDDAFWSYKNNGLIFSSLNKSAYYCNISFGDFNSNEVVYLKDEVQNNAQYKSETYGYRYNGKKPNNYVWFNNELYRIIGLIPTCLSESCSTEKKLVKIIRNDNLGYAIYDSNYINVTGNYVNSLIYTLLNSYFYHTNENSNATESEYCKLGIDINGKCNFSITGIQSNSQFGKMLENVYWNSSFINHDNNAFNLFNLEKNEQNTSGYIGLMNASDFAFGTDSSNYDTSLIYYNYDSYDTPNNTNWLNYGSLQHVMNLNQYIFEDPEEVVFYGINYGSSMNPSPYRPVMYLKENVYIISGSGSEVDPYIIEM